MLLVVYVLSYVTYSFGIVTGIGSIPNQKHCEMYRVEEENITIRVPAAMLPGNSYICNYANIVTDLM